MGSPIAIVTADTHLDEYAWADRPGLYGDSEHSFEQIVRFGTKLNVPIIAAGDLIDKKRNDSGPIGFLRRQMDKLQEADIPFWYIQGQHELQPGRPWLSEIHGWPTWLDAPCDDPAENYQLLADRFDVRGIDWTPYDKIEARLEEIHEDCHVLVMHQVMTDFMGSVAQCEMSSNRVRHARVLVVGDYHVHKKEQSRTIDGEELLVLSPGSTHMRAINEEPIKRFFVLFNDLTAKSLRLKTRPHLPSVIATEDDLDKFVEIISARVDDAMRYSIEEEGSPEHIAVPIIDVEYYPDLVDFAYNRIVEAVGDQGFLFLKEHVASNDYDEDEEQRKEIAGLGLAGCLPMVVEDTESELFTATERLLRSTTPEEELALIREGRLDEADEATAN